MFTKKVFVLSFLALSLLAFGACSDDKDLDTEGPKVTLISPTNDQKFSRGSAILMEFVLEDESGINQYTVDIHWAGDGHGHGSGGAEEGHGKTPDNAYAFKEVYKDASGKVKVEVSLETTAIPADAALGEYHFGVLATDMVGNITQRYADIEIVE